MRQRAAPSFCRRRRSLPRFWGEAAHLLAPLMTFPNHVDHTDAALIAPATIAAGLDGLYAEADMRRSLAERGLARTRAACFQWPEICERWRGLLLSLA